MMIFILIHKYVQKLFLSLFLSLSDFCFLYFVFFWSYLFRLDFTRETVSSVKYCYFVIDIFFCMIAVAMEIVFSSYW